MSPRPIIFDLDGTLIDSLDDIASALNHVLPRFGRAPRTIDDVTCFIGDGARMLVRRALEADDETPAGDEDAVLEAFRERYRAHPCENTRAYPGIDTVLEELQRAAVPTSILSNKPHDLTVVVVAALWSDYPFRFVFGQRDHIPRKPDPQAAIEIASNLQRPSADFAFVGDSPVDMETARRAGMLPIGVSWGTRTPEELRRAGALHVVDDTRSLLSLLLSESSA